MGIMKSLLSIVFGRQVTARKKNNEKIEKVGEVKRLSEESKCTVREWIDQALIQSTYRIHTYHIYIYLSIYISDRSGTHTEHIPHSHISYIYLSIYIYI